MKYIRKTTKDIKSNFLKELLIDRGIIPREDAEYQEKFFHPTKEKCNISPLKLDHMEEGFKLFEKHLKKGSKIYFVADADVDGYTSSSVMINYMRDNLREKFPNWTVDYHIHEGKEHGLSTIMDVFTQSKICDLIILPDSSSNDYIYHKELKDLGYDILIEDHHMADHYSDDAIVINNQLSECYENKELSGVGVVYKFLQYCDSQWGINGADKYLDLVAVGQCADMVSLNTLENRFITDYGFSHFKNVGIRALIKQQAYSLFGKSSSDINELFLDSTILTPIQVAFYIAPLVNALIRVGSLSEKRILFRSFIEGNELIESTKRGHKGEMETIAEQSARNCFNARSRQNREKDKAMEILDIQISNDCLDDNKILILNADDLDVSNALTGLCAMGVSAKYKKPVILGRTCPDGCLKGSIRGINGSELKDFRQFLLDSELMSYVEGHANAAGFGIKLSNISKLYSYANNKLHDINFNEGFYEADFVVNGNCSYLSDLIFDLCSGDKFYGQENSEPVIIVENISLNINNIQIIGSNKDTLKFVFNDITYIKFKASDIIEQLKKYSENVKLTIAGKGNINEWGGRKTPQILINEIEIKESNDYDF